MYVSKMGSSLFFSGGLILRTEELTQKGYLAAIRA
jgi:hypothetical protein